MRTFEINSKVYDVDLSNLFPYTEWTGYSQYFKDCNKREHYKLMAFLSGQCEDGEKIYDIGTFLGFSALALAHNPDVNVVTYDLTNHFNTTQLTAKDYPNITFKLADCTQKEELVDIVKAPFIFLDVDPHDGVQEPQIFKAFQDAGFKGLLFLDDIHLNEPMKQFWNSITLKKYDITSYGHWSGTGVVVFDETSYDVHITK